MAFEHDQFARFMASPPPSRNGRASSVVYPQKPSVLARPPRRIVMKMDGTNRRRRTAQIAVVLKLALLCSWLLHELVVNFDESQCLRIASVPPLPPPPVPPPPPPNAMPNTFSPAALANTTNAKSAEESAGDAHRRRHTETDDEVPHTMGQRALSAPPLSKSVGLPRSIGEERQFHGQTDANNLVPKRRRKVIIRRKLLRKGATASDWQQQKKGGGNAKSAAAVRRVVWRVVPLKRLSQAREGEEEEEEEEAQHTVDDGNESAGEQRQNHRFDTFPFENEFAVPSLSTDQRKMSSGGDAVRTKTGTVVVVRRTDGGARRRMARRRTTTAPGGGESADDTDAANGAVPSADSLWPTPLRRPLRLPLVHQSAEEANIPDQLVTLLSAGLCLLRALFDCWALIQCFCCALFLLGLHLRRPPLLLLPIAFDAFSAVLAFLCCLSLVVFLLVLLLLAHSVLPALSLLRCAMFTVAVYVGAILFAFCVFCEQRALAETRGSKRRRRKRKGEEGKRHQEEGEEEEEEEDGREDGGR